jgi:hypothetical protein
MTCIWLGERNPASATRVPPVPGAAATGSGRCRGIRLAERPLSRRRRVSRQGRYQRRYRPRDRRGRSTTGAGRGRSPSSSAWCCSCVPRVHRYGVCSSSAPTYGGRRTLRRRQKGILVTAALSRCAGSPCSVRLPSCESLGHGFDSHRRLRRPVLLRLMRCGVVHMLIMPATAGV